MVKEAAQRFQSVVKKPATIWAVLLTAAIPALVDRFLVQPEKDEQRQTIEQVQWEELKSALEQFQRTSEDRRDRLLEKQHSLDLKITKIEATLGLIMSGRRLEAKRTLGEPNLEIPEITHTQSETVSLPDLSEVKEKAIKRISKR